MSVSLYYTAKRDYPMTEQEQTACEKIAERYDTEYPFGELWEGFCIYDLQKSPYVGEENVIFAGATALPPSDDEEDVYRVLDWWMQCLLEIADVLQGVTWNVHLDDASIILEEWS